MADIISLGAEPTPPLGVPSLGRNALVSKSRPRMDVHRTKVQVAKHRRPGGAPRTSERSAHLRCHDRRRADVTHLPQMRRPITLGLGEARALGGLLEKWFRGARRGEGGARPRSAVGWQCPPLRRDRGSHASPPWARPPTLGLGRGIHMDETASRPAPPPLDEEGTPPLSAAAAFPGPGRGSHFTLGRGHPPPRLP